MRPSCTLVRTLWTVSNWYVIYSWSLFSLPNDQNFLSQMFLCLIPNVFSVLAVCLCNHNHVASAHGLETIISMCDLDAFTPQERSPLHSVSRIVTVSWKSHVCALFHRVLKECSWNSPSLPHSCVTNSYLPAKSDWSIFCFTVVFVLNLI